ncbi:MAG: twitching motility protein PilT [Chitinophagaceae bacterium]|nr:twitching motility protein PilT [Chitinophagaceae bacterium]
MKVFLDANILVSVLNKEYPLFSHSSRVLSLAGVQGFQLYSSPICFAIAFYFAAKKSGQTLARRKIGILAEHIRLAENRQSDLKAVAADKTILDLEDGLEYYAAKNAGCRRIVTEDICDFHFAAIEVLAAKPF